MTSGPCIDPQGLDFIMGYLGRNPAAKTHAEAAAAMARVFPEFEGVPDGRWLEEARKHYTPDRRRAADHLRPASARCRCKRRRRSPRPTSGRFSTRSKGCRWPASAGRNSNLLSAETLAEMQRRRPDMIVAEVPGRGHVPFLDEPEAVAALHDWIGANDMNIDMIRAAAGRLEGHVRRTPLLNSPFLDEIAGRRVWVKPECLQHTGSFKFRGAWSALSALDPDVRAQGRHRLFQRQPRAGRGAGGHGCTACPP